MVSSVFLLTALCGVLTLSTVVSRKLEPNGVGASRNAMTFSTATLEATIMEDPSVAHVYGYQVALFGEARAAMTAEHGGEFTRTFCCRSV